MMIFILLTELSACVSTRENIQIYNVPMKDNNPTYNAYFIVGRRASHFPKNKVYVVSNLSINEGVLTADLNDGYNRPWNVFSIYVKSDSLIKTDSKKHITVYLADIDEVKVEKINWLAALGYTALSIVAFSFFIVAIYGAPNDTK